MLTICCTKKLLDELKLKPCKIVEQKPLFSWYANLFTLHRRKTVLLLNEYSRYPVLIYGLKAVNFKQIDQIVVGAVQTIFFALGIAEDIVEKYLEKSVPVEFAKTSDRSVVSTMNQIIQTLPYYPAGELDLEHPVQTEISLRLGKGITKIDGDYKEPQELLLGAMSYFAQGGEAVRTKPVISVPAYQFLISLALENHEVWRRVIVPVNISFRKLHYVIQDVFGWQSYHLYEFGIVSGRRLVTQIVCNEEGLEYADAPAGLDNKTRLAKYLPQYRQMGYIYDMGDNWKHIVELEKIIEDYGKNYPICVDGEGSCPPEDVGGEGGYEDFLAAIGDPKNPEHEDMIEWGEEQGYCAFDLAEVNHRLRHSLKRRM